MKFAQSTRPMMVVTCVLVGCAASTEPRDEATTSQVTQATQVAKCKNVQPKDSLISQLVYDSWVAAYPITRLSVDATGNVVGPSLPDLVAGDLQVINTVPEARDAMARALTKVSGLPDYGIGAITFASDACTAVPAWTPTGTTTIDTGAFSVDTGGVNTASWKTTHRELGKECALLKSAGEVDIIDPPGDGSTDAPVSSTVSATGVVANAFGLCPSGTPVGTYCKLSYATGVNWTGRSCQYYYGQLRCVVM